MEPKRLLILGATGRTGRELVDIALARGHQVTAFVRSPAKVTRRDPRLTVVKGDPRNAEELSRAMPGHDAVLSALGPLPREAMTRSTLLEESASSAMTALLRSGVRRFLVVSSAMLFPGGGPVAALLRLMLRPHVRDLKAMEERVRAAGIEWTIARPPRLVAAADESYRAQPGGLPPGVTLVSGVLSWRAVAAFLLDAVESGRHQREIVGVCR